MPGEDLPVDPMYAYEDSVLEEHMSQDEGDLLADGDPLDTGIVAPEKWSPGERFGNTQAEQAEGESLDQHLAQEEPEPDPYALAGQAPYDYAAGSEPDPRAGRLVADDEGSHPVRQDDLVAHDVGIDAGAAGAEEAAVHITDNPGGLVDH